MIFEQYYLECLSHASYLVGDETTGRVVVVDPQRDVESYVLARQKRAGVLLDTREPFDFAAGHLRGAIDVGLQGRFAEWVGDVLDPRRDIGDPGETGAGVLPDAREMPLPTLVDSLDRLHRSAPIVVYCASGYRSAIGASVLRPQGRRRVGSHRRVRCLGQCRTPDCTVGIRAAEQ
jgi:rhodanese-related sulfurtransferase